jgi:hypothetical protein
MILRKTINSLKINYLHTKQPYTKWLLELLNRLNTYEHQGYKDDQRRRKTQSKRHQMAKGKNFWNIKLHISPFVIHDKSEQTLLLISATLTWIGGFSAALDYNQNSYSTLKSTRC